MFTLLDRVRDTSTTTGTGTITVSGVAPATFFAFSTLGVGASFDYVIAHRTANEVEVGRGTRVSGTTFSRDLVLRSSNGNALVSFSAGTKDVFLTMAAASLTQLDEMLLVFTPMRYGAIGDGVADDTVAVLAAVAAANALAVSLGGAAGKVKRVMVDGSFLSYLVSEQVLLANDWGSGAAVGLCNITLIAGAGFPANTALVRGTGNRPTFDCVTLDCNRIAATGLRMSGYSGYASDVLVFNFLADGIIVDTSGDQVLDNCDVFQWNPSDPEFSVRADWTGTCYSMRHADERVIDCIGHTAGVVLEFTADSGTTQVTGCNFWNGNYKADEPGNEAWAHDFENTTVIYVEPGAGAIVLSNCYFGNGRSELYSDSVVFRGCTAIANAVRDNLDYFIGLYSPLRGGSPTYHASSGWIWAGRPFGPEADDKTPFYRFFDTGAGGAIPGDFTSFEEVVSSGGTLEMSETIHSWRTAIDAGPNIIYGSAGPGGASGAGVGLISASTPKNMLADPPSIRERDGGIYLYRAKRSQRVITATDDLYLNNSGQDVLVQNPLDATLRLPAIAYQGWHCWVILGEDSVGVVTLAAQTASPQTSLVHKRSLSGPVDMVGKWSRVHVTCIENADGESAIFVVDGDADLSSVTTYGNGYSYTFQNLDGGEALIENTTLATVVLPQNARKGWHAGFTRSATSSAAVHIQSNTAYPASVLWGLNGAAYLSLDPEDRVEIVCLSNADGESAIFVVGAVSASASSGGALTFKPKTTADSLSVDGQVTFERVSNAQLGVLMRGTDDVTNRYVLPLSVAGNSQKTICSETVLHIGPSYTARMTPFFSIDPDTWSRTSGVGTFHTENDAVDWIVGHKFRIQDTSNEWVEGQFTVLTNTPATSPPRSVITYADARANKVSGDLVGNGIAACDLQAWSCASGVPAYVSIAMGGSVRYITLGTNGTGVVGWMLPERQAQIRAIGPVGTVVIDGGSVGGSVNDDGLSGDDAYEALRDFIEFIRPQCNSVWAGTPPPYGAVAVNSAIYAAGTVLVHRMQNLAREYPFVKIIPFAEALTTRYGIVDSTELLSGLQPPNDLCTDGVHDQEGAAAAKGAIIGHCLMRDFRPRYPLGGNYPDNRIVASGTDVGGRKNPNLLTGWFGAVSTNAASGSGISGTKPTSGDLTGTAWTGTATAISSVVVNPDGGSDWVVGFGSPTTSPGTNTLFTMAWTGGRSAGELLTAVNTAANKGKEIDIWVDCGVGGFEPGGVTYVDLALWLTTAADGEWRQASGLSPEGDYQAVEQNKAMLTGINGRIRFPRTVLPNKTYTAAEFRLTVKPTQGTTGRNLGARARIGPSFRLEVVELVE